MRVLRYSITAWWVICALEVASRLKAQDVVVTPLAWVTREPPEQLPVLRSVLRPEFPRDVRNTPDIGYVVIETYVDEKGKSLGGRREATFSAYDKVVDAQLAGGLKFEPGRRAGQPVNTRVRCVVIFNPATAAAEKPDATPRLLDARLIIDPNRRGKPNETSPPAEVVWATVSLDPRGKSVAIKDAPAELAPLFEKSIATWKFAPARAAGQPVAAEVRVPFIVVAVTSGTPSGPQIAPRVIHQTKPEYPLAQRASGLRGEVLLDFTVDIEGRVTNPVVVRTLNPAFNEPALDAIRQWTFEPGRRGGVPVPTHMQVPVLFQLDGRRGGGDAGVSITSKAKPDNVPAEFRYDVAPKPRGRVLPIYPFALLRDGTSGAATVRFIIGENGKVAFADVLKTTNLEFGAAVVAAVERFEFEPALKAGQPTRAVLTFEQTFEPGSEELVSASDRELVALERKHPERIVGASKLDTALKPMSQRQPAFPLAMKGKVQKGDAVIEFLVDEEGRARLPRIVKASDAAFGYAAVQAITEWRFQPPKAGGKTVVARVQAPFKFAAPASDPAAPGRR